MGVCVWPLMTSLHSCPHLLTKSWKLSWKVSPTSPSLKQPSPTYQWVLPLRSLICALVYQFPAVCGISRPVPEGKNKSTGFHSLSDCLSPQGHRLYSQRVLEGVYPTSYPAYTCLGPQSLSPQTSPKDFQFNATSSPFGTKEFYKMQVPLDNFT